MEVSEMDKAATVVERGTGRPANGAYKNAAGKRVVSVSTITGRFEDKSNLIGWAYKRGIEGVPLYESRDRACDIGTAVHDAAEAHIVDGSLPTFDGLQDEFRADAMDAFATFLRWYGAMKPTIVAVEVPMVSESMGVAGTFDAVGYIDGKLCLLDWKTSSGLYGSYIVQVAGYVLLWEEKHPDKPIEEIHIVRFSKESGAFEHRSWPARKFGVAKRQFVRLVEAYKDDKEIAKLLK